MAGERLPRAGDDLRRVVVAVRADEIINRQVQRFRRAVNAAALASTNSALAASLARFAGSEAFGLNSLRDDFARFRFLLGVTDGEGVFTPDES